MADQTNAESLPVGPFVLANGNAVTSVEAMAFNPTTGVLYGTNQGRLGTIDRATGLFTAVGPATRNGAGSAGSQAIDNIDGLAFDAATGSLFGCERRGGNNADLLVRLNPATGALVANAFGNNVTYAVLTTTAGVQCDDLAIHPTTGVLYGAFNGGATGSRIGTIDKSTGAVTLLTGLVTASDANLDDVLGLSFTASGTLYASTGTNGRLASIDLTTGAGTNGRSTA